MTSSVLSYRRAVVPWRNPEEFCKVYKCLYSNSLTDKRWALDQINVWESRVHPALSTAIDATSQLIEAEIQDSLAEVGKSLISTKGIRMEYAMAVTRFISIVLEVDQNEGKKRKSLASLAEMKQIPFWVVELRQDSVHAFFPSLAILRMGAQFALKYLEKYFWKVEAASIRPVILTPSPKNQKILELINKYKALQRLRLKENAELPEIVPRDFKEVLSQIRFFVRENKKQFIDVLVQPDVFICDEDIKEALANAEMSFFISSVDELTLNPYLERFWIVLIKILHDCDAIPLFIEKLILSQQECHSPVRQKTAASWVNRIYFAATTYNKQRSTLEQIFNKKGVLFNLHVIMYACMKGGNVYLTHVFDFIATSKNLQQKFTGLYVIMGVYQGLFLKKEKIGQVQRISQKRPKDTMEEIFFTLEDAEEDINELKAKRRKIEERNNPEKRNPWSLAPVSMKWESVPLGTVINPVNKEDLTEETVESPVAEEQRFIFANENDNEEITSHQEDTPDNSWMETFKPDKFDMVYRRQKN